MTVVTKDAVTLLLSDKDFRDLVAGAVCRELIQNYQCELAVSCVMRAAGKWSITYVQKEIGDVD